MNSIPYDKSFFVKKDKQKYPRNKFFSYNNVDRSNRNFNFKDFRNSNSYNTKFTHSSFYGTYFQKSTMKYCSFNGATFKSIDFINCNFRGSRFKGTTFKNCIFKNCKLTKCNFKNAKFINTYFKSSGIEKTKNLNKHLVSKKLPNIVTNDVLEELNINSYNYNLRSSLSQNNLNRLLAYYKLKDIKSGLNELNNKDIKIITFSHLTIFIERKIS